VLQSVPEGAEVEDQAAGPGQLDDLSQDGVDRDQNLEQRVPAAKQGLGRPVLRMARVIELPEGGQQLPIQMNREHAEIPAAVAEQRPQRRRISRTRIA
jgi:hypothetical protein